MNGRAIFVAVVFCASLGGAFIAGRETQPASASAAVAPAKVAKSMPSVAASGAHEPPASGDGQGLSPPDIEAIASYEDLMYAQPDLVDESVSRLRARTPGKVGLYALGFAGDAEENVFLNEVDYLPKLLAERFDAAGRTVQLVNSPYTFAKTALATRTNLYDALSGLAGTMDPDNDILLLFLTSHGSRDHQLYVEMGTLPLDQLTPDDIRDALDRAKIRWRVIVVSACYAGGFIPALREPHTMVITASSGDRSSFGCGSDSQLTWFGKAFLVDALNRTSDFHAAFDDARQSIAQWEQRDHQTPSQPQFWEGPLIEAKLASWRATLPAGKPPVHFSPAPIPVASRHATR